MLRTIQAAWLAHCVCIAAGSSACHRSHGFIEEHDAKTTGPCGRHEACSREARCKSPPCNGERGSGESGLPTMRAVTDAGGRGPRSGLDTELDLDSFDASVEFDEPIDAPRPTRELKGEGLDALVGVWQEDPEASNHRAGPIRLEIQRDDATGGYTGSISFRCASDDCDPMGPPPPAVDPDRGYPPDLPPIEQDMLRIDPFARFEYAVLDGRWEDARFQFWFSNKDLWREWCTLQMSYRVALDGGRTQYACVPDPEPYALVPRRMELDGKQQLCSSNHSVCHCDSSGCRVSYQGAAHESDLALKGDTLQGLLRISPDTLPVTLHKQEGP